MITVGKATVTSERAYIIYIWIVSQHWVSVTAAGCLVCPRRMTVMTSHANQIPLFDREVLGEGKTLWGMQATITSVGLCVRYAIQKGDYHEQILNVIYSWTLEIKDDSCENLDNWQLVSLFVILNFWIPKLWKSPSCESGLHIAPA